MLLHFLSGLVLVAGGVFFIALTALILARPAVAERFFRGFASSVRTHFVEQILRVLLGGSLVLHSPSMWQSGVFRLFGWVMVLTSVGLMLIPWQWHHRFATKILPLLIRHMRLYAIGTFALGAVILYAVLAPQLKGGT